MTLLRNAALLAPLLLGVSCRSTSASDSIRLAPGHAICPVCQAEGDLACEDVTIGPDTPRSVRDGVAYYFCSAECRKEFDRHAEKYLPR